MALTLVEALTVVEAVRHDVDNITMWVNDIGHHLWRIHGSWYWWKIFFFLYLFLVHFMDMVA